MVIAILNAIAAIPALAGYLKDFINQVMLWYIQRQSTETLAAINDAAAFSARAKTDDDRYASAKKWQDALSRSRVTLT